MTEQRGGGQAPNLSLAWVQEPNRSAPVNWTLSGVQTSALSPHPSSQRITGTRVAGGVLRLR